MIQSRSEVVVRYAETDMMGIVYHGSYLPWLEIGRTELLREVGIAYARLEQLGYRLPVLEVQMNYLKPALYDQRIEIVTTMHERPRIRMRLDYELFHEGTLIATGHTVHAFINHSNQPVRPPAELVDLFRGRFGG
jgi:acyl-CoA thioester hydrolase